MPEMGEMIEMVCSAAQAPRNMCFSGVCVILKTYYQQVEKVPSNMPLSSKLLFHAAIWKLRGPAALNTHQCHSASEYQNSKQRRDVISGNE